MSSIIENHIDINLYDRQVRTYGVDAIKKITKSSILIMGLTKGLGTEVAKNLTLGGIRNIYLFDENNISENDLETGYYYSKELIGQKRSVILQDKLKELNPYVNIYSVNNFKQNQHVTIIINQPVETINEISNYCRQNNIKLIVVFSGGMSGAIFVDAINHTINDATGEIIESVQIGEINEAGKVKCATNSSHDFQTGDFIKFENLEGDNMEQFKDIEWEIKVINKFNIQLKNFNNIKPFKFINGTMTHIKKPIEISHQSWEEQKYSPTVSFSFDMDYSENIVKTYLQMYSNNLIHTMPFIWSNENNSFMEQNKIILPNQAKTFNLEFIPVVSIIGSMAASEAIKLITNKYQPINQWFTWTDEYLIPVNKPENFNTNSSYSILYGNDFENKLSNSKWLMVGSGAIGCEHLKNLAFMGVGNSKSSGQIIITDPDTIEKSNLNRQFLFRSQHIGKPKSEVASEMIREMKPDMNIKAYLQKVGSDNLEFTEQLFKDKNITGVLNALDNIKARKFMDEQCFKYNLPLFEAGTTGTKGNTQPVIPFITETYSASSDPEQEKTYPICTIKSFPNEIHHTIHWAMDQFELFNRGPLTMNKWIDNHNYINELEEIERTQVLSDINLFTIKYHTQNRGITNCTQLHKSHWQQLCCCAEWAVDMFTENYYNNIVQLLYTFKPDYEVEPGVLFWSAGKRCPKPVQFDINNKQHLDYIIATTHLLARSSGIDDNFSTEDLINMIKDYKSPEFIPQDKKIASNDSELDKINKDINTDIKVGNYKDFKPIYVPQIFEKDDDSNWHISWITAASNMRAINYGIPIIDYHQTKGIAGRIIPAISTTTSAISGLVLLEMLKYMQDCKQIEKYRSTFINLAEPVMIYSEPLSAPQIDIAGIKVNSWTKFEYTQNNTLQEFKQYYEDMFKTTINMIVNGTNLMYADFIGDENLNKNILDIIKESDDSSSDKVTINIFTEENKELPVITYIIN